MPRVLPVQQRSSICRLAVLSSCLLVLTGFPSESSAQEVEKPPNIVFLFTDDQRSDAVGYAGNDVIQTPYINRLARQSLRFNNCFVTTSICCISRASVLSGQYMRRHGIDGFNKAFSTEALQQTYPAILQRHGYYTGFIGKWGVGTSPQKTNQGAKIFDYWQGQPHQTNFWHEPDCAYVIYDGKATAASGVCDCPADARGKEGWDVRAGKAHLEEPRHLTTEIVPAKIEEFLETRDPAKPFCLSVFFKAPHGPYDFDPRYERLYADQSMPIPLTAKPEYEQERPQFLRERQLGNNSGRHWIADREALEQHIRDYYRLITGADYAIGQLMEQLQQQGLADNTVILFTSDNGSFHGEHGFAGKWLMREPSIRVPGFVFDPRVPATQRNRSTDRMVLNIDFTATILDLAGIRVPDTIQGESLRALVEHSGASDGPIWWRDEWFYEHEYLHGGAIQPTIGVRTEQWKYTRYTAQSPRYEELFHIEVDPEETNDLAMVPEHQQRLIDMRKRCDEYARQLQ